MDVELKDIVSLTIGTVIGLLVGVAIYWLPLGQFINEWRSIWHLTHKRYKRGDDIIIRAGTDLTLLGSQQPTTAASNQDVVMKFWHDEGIGWYHTASGWKRARILHVFPAANTQKIYRTCHWDLKEG